MSKHTQREKAAQLYSFLLSFYPQGYRQAFGSQMLQTFKDHYADSVELDQQTKAHFWFGVITDELKAIVHEQVTHLKGSKHMKEVWVKQGILFGIILGMLVIAYNAVNNLAPASTALNSFLGTSFMIVIPIFTGVAGYYAARKAEQMKAGTYAGLLTGFLSMAIGMSALFVITFAFIDIIRHNQFMIYDFQRSGLTNIDDFIVQDTIGGAFFGTLFSLVIGAVCGTVGGYLGIQVKGVKS